MQSIGRLGELPGTVALVDGGVYNNFGYDWFDLLGQEEGAKPPAGEVGERALELSLKLKTRTEEICCCNGRPYC